MGTEAVVSNKGRKPVETGIVLVSALRWVVNEVVLFGSLGDTTVVGSVMVDGPELVNCEVITPGAPGETVTVGTDELVSIPGCLPTEGVTSKLLSEKLEGCWVEAG